MIIRDVALEAGAVVRLPREYKVLGMSGPYPWLSVEVNDALAEVPYAVLQLRAGDAVPAGARYVGSLPPAPSRWVNWRTPGPRHFYLCEVAK